MTDEDRMTAEGPVTDGGRVTDEGQAIDDQRGPADEQVRLTAWVSGRVQGVGFRWWTRVQALRLDLVGTATNLADGRVEVVAEGRRAACQRLVERLESSDTPGAVVHVASRYSEPRGDLTGFRER